MKPSIESVRAEPLATPSVLHTDAVAEIGLSLLRLLADHLALYVKTKNFHWHLSGPGFRDFHRAFDEQADELLGAVDPLAERARKLGTPTLRSVGQLRRLTRVRDSDEPYVPAREMLAQLRDDNFRLLASLRESHRICSDREDFGSTGLIETLIDQAETRHWFLFEMGRPEEVGRTDVG